MNNTKDQNEQANDAPVREAYEAPMVLKKRSVARVTLFSGGGVTAGGLTSSG